MWERACSRMRYLSRQMYWLIHRIREQARSHIWSNEPPGPNTANCAEFVIHINAKHQSPRP
ncbi:hypothetical protein FFI16_011165 [Pseudomonas sp. KBS0710]|nr:hypothetical protein FFI16_011165 [Pseudomonas sp. KBS0710]